MRLRSLEIKGFKSFADRTIINFSEDVIGIVGSNGCGKSNIVDAIRWVLGEQKTKQLRSESMTSVIFNGTKARKSAPWAEVTLTFDNNKGILPLEYQQVSIKRSLHKDGTSAYFLNGVKCRLKDISNLLVDTGMGSDSYAIIALGMVDELLQDKNNSRLKLFEQAAGISKYKVRKKETFSKLKRTENDLERVEDLLYEVEKNLKSLKKQAKRAQTYLDLKTEYRRLSLELSYFKIDACKQEYKRLNEKIKIEETHKKEFEQKIDEFEDLLVQNKKDSVHREEALGYCRRKLSSLIGKIKTKESDKKMLTQKTLFIQQNNDKIDDRIEENKQKLVDVEKAIDVQSEKLDAAFEEGKTLSSELADAKEALTMVKKMHGNTKAELDDYISKQKSIDNKVFNHEKELAVLQNQETSAKQNITRLKEKIKERSLEIQAVSKQAETLKKQQGEQEEILKKVRKQEEERQEQLEAINTKIEAAQEKSVAKNRQLDAKQNEYDLLKSLVDNMEGFSESIKFLSKNEKWAENAPLVSDIFYCPPKYRTAIENYLDPYLSYYVVQSFTEALQAIELLDKHEKGKANFFLLEQFPKDRKVTPKTQEGVWALDILDFDEEYLPLAQHLLANVYIVPEKKPSAAFDKDMVWLTEDGKFIQKGYAVRGGFVGAFEGKKIGRKKNLELLEKQIEELSAEAIALQEQLKQHKNKLQTLRQANYTKAIEKAERQLQTTIREAISVSSKIDNFEAFREENEGLIATHEKQISKQKEQKLRLQTLLAKLQKEVIDLRDSVAEKDASVQAIASSVSEASTKYNRKHIEQVKQQNTITAIEKELDHLYRKHKELKDQRKRDEQILNEADTNLSKAETQIKEIEEKLEEWYELKKEYQVNQSAAEKAYFKAKGATNENEKILRQHQKNYNRTIELIGKLENKFHDVKLELTTIAERLNVEFEIKINDLVDEEPNPEFDEAVLESNVNQLRNRLNNYGSINPMAIEAFNEIQGRHETIINQREDLTEARKNLLQTIKEVEAKATTQFMEAFNKVRKHFVHVFRSLFMENDTCDLVLTDPEQPLDSRIEIIAKPKGKRPLSINQLSGGEKTLTATALLFSLYLLKPAPFCIFDEVDAPLDDANIAKFNNIVQEFSENSQFIIVTHNKKTMEAVDIMYGVTMVQGVSRVVPVDFRELEAVT